MAGQLLDTVGIVLDSREYLLIRDQDQGKVGSRRWSVESRPLTTKRNPRMDVQVGDIAGEYIQTIDDWSEGICGDREGFIGGVHFTENAHGLIPGSLFPIPPNVSSTDTNDEGANIVPTAAVDFNGETFVAHGRYLYQYTGGNKVVDEDFGAGKVITDLIVHNNALLVALDGSNKVQSRDTAGTYTSTDNVYVKFFAKVEDRLWIALNTNEIQNCGPTDNPLLTASYTASITIGDDDYAITDLNAYGDRVAVSKVDGLYLGDSQAIFPNVLPMIAATPDPENGRNTLVKGADIYYPHANGVIRYRIGGAEELGIQKVFPSATVSDNIPGTRITAMAIEGLNIWAVTEPAMYPRARPTSFQKTVDSGTGYTSYLSEVTDASLTTVAVLDSLDTVVNGDWLLVGYSAPFYGVILDIGKPNGTAATLTVEYWNGSAWTAMPATTSVYDRTTKSSLATPTTAGTIPLSRSGAITWSNSSLGSWAASTVNSINAYYIRFSVSTAIDAEVEVTEAWVLTSEPRCYVFRGRPGHSSDRRDDTVIWEPYSYCAGMSYAGAMLVTADHYPGNRREQLVISGRQIDVFQRLPVSAIEMPEAQNSQQGKVYTPKYDGGTPFMTKQYLSVSIKGKNIDSDRDIGVEYRLDDATSWTSLSSSSTSNPVTFSLSGISGRTIQLRLTFNAFSTATNQEYPSINFVEIRYRERPTEVDHITFTALVGDEMYNAAGGALPDGNIQLTNLNALVYGAPVTLLSPIRESKNVMVRSVREAEVLQEGLQMPALAVEVVCVETA